MSQNVQANSISTSWTAGVRFAWQAMVASWWARMREQYGSVGAAGYLLVWIAIPVFELATAGLIYRGHRPELLRYAVVGVAGNAFVLNSLYYIGQMLDEQRLRGTLVGLFLAPCPRLGWLTGLALGGLLDAAMAAVVAVVFGVLVFGVHFDPNYPALLLSCVLFLLSLWGMGFVFSAIGLVIKKSNDLANLVSPFLTLLGGVLYPIALLPRWLQMPAHALPLGYGMQAMAGAALHHTGIASLAPQLVPLAGFAVALPVIGMWTFGWLERGVRQRGELDLY